MIKTERKISVAELELGMYVARLDRPWVETHFLFQGFHISNDQDIRELRETCEYVYVDPECDEIDYRRPRLKTITAEEHSDSRLRTRVASRMNERLEAILGAPPPREFYPVSTAVENEIPVARESHRQTVEVISTLVGEVKAGKTIELDSVRETVGGMIASIVRNPDAFLWLTRLKNKDAYAYMHCVDACGLSVAFGRYLGFSRTDLENLAIGTLLFDIGKLQLPDSLLKKPGRLTDPELELIRRHVEFGVDIVKEMQGVNKDIISIILNHHERHDGSGYPRGLAGRKIPVKARIAALVDCYDAIISDRAYSSAISSYDAIQVLYESRDKDFQADIVEQFIQCVGLYPTGTLVELSNGEVGLVLAQNRVRRLRPRVMLVLRQDKSAYDFNPILDLIEDPVDENGTLVEIRQPLPPGSYGISAADYYL
ncbi:MAG: HD-GYP domain-containing protein [Thiogranum sp.]|nr:HD-GYP domain-containing protein [Thiogranum sp.]